MKEEKIDSYAHGMELLKTLKSIDLSLRVIACNEIIEIDRNLSFVSVKDVRRDFHQQLHDVLKKAIPELVGSVNR